MRMMPGAGVWRNAAELKCFSSAARKKLRRGIFMDGKDLVIRWGKGIRTRWPLRSNLPGPHNVENILASVAMALCRRRAGANDSTGAVHI